MTRVYVVNKSGHDYRDAERFGTIVFCTTGPIDRWDISQMYREMVEAMYDSQEGDYILITSLTSLCSVACAVFAAKHQMLNLLIHKGQKYVSRSLHLKNFNDTRGKR